MSQDFISIINPLPGLEYQGQEDLSQTPRKAEFQVIPKVDNTNRHFKGQHKDEIVLCFCRKHWITLLPHFAGMAILFAATAAFFIFVAPADIQSAVSGSLYRFSAFLVILGATLYIHSFFLRFFNYYLQTFIITNFRVVQLDQTLFFQQNRDSVDLREIQDIVVNQKGILKTLLNYGEIIITMSSAHATKVLQRVPNPEYHFRKINKTKREYITNRGLRKLPNNGITA